MSNRRRRLLSIASVGLLLAMLVALNGCGPTIIFVDFEDPASGTTYLVGNTILDSGITMPCQTFYWSGGTPTNDGNARIDNLGRAGGSGQDLNTNNINISFNYGGPGKDLTLLFGEYGGNLNITINGDFRNFANFVDINGLTIGGCTVTVVNGLGNDIGSLSLSGTVNSFIIGGQELWIDNVQVELL